MPKNSGFVTTPDRSLLMAKVRQSNTSAEMAVRRIIRNCGFFYRTKARDLPGTPDIANRKDRWAIFVNGCFWHAHRGCPRGKIPKTNQAFWAKKFSDNQERDRKNISDLKKICYSVLTVWECELDDKPNLETRVRQFFERVRLRR